MLVLTCKILFTHNPASFHVYRRVLEEVSNSRVAADQSVAFSVYNHPTEYPTEILDQLISRLGKFLQA
jgi:hypothetical protein